MPANDGAAKHTYIPNAVFTDRQQKEGIYKPISEDILQHECREASTQERTWLSNSTEGRFSEAKFPSPGVEGFVRTVRCFSEVQKTAVLLCSVAVPITPMAPSLREGYVHGACSYICHTWDWAGMPYAFIVRGTDRQSVHRQVILRKFVVELVANRRCSYRSAEVDAGKEVQSSVSPRELF